jgi:hypothetical protein
VELTEDYHKPAWDWYTKHINPIVNKMYLGDREAVRRLTMRAWEALSAPELNEDQRQCVRYRLSYVVWQDKLRLGTLAEAREGYAELIQRLTEPAAGVLSRAVRQRMLLQTGAQAEVEGIAPFPPEEYFKLRLDLPGIVCDPELYHFIASWAFHRQQIQPLEEAMEVMTFSPTGYQSDFAWQRVNVMYLLLQNKAAKRDLLELIKRMEYPHHWRVVKSTLWDEVIKAGLVDTQIEQALERRLAELETMQPKVPGYTEHTLRIRKDL